MHIVIIGNGPAAVKSLEAVAECRRLSSDGVGQITVVSAETTGPYAPMFLAGCLTGELGEKELAIGEEHGLPVRRILGEKVMRVEDAENTVILESGQEIGYDRLLIASGASAVRPPVSGSDKEGIYFFNRLADLKKLSTALPGVDKVIVIGGGAIGVEAAIAFNRLGKSVVVVEQLGQCLPQMLDEELARQVERELTGWGIGFRLGECVSEITGSKKATGIVIGDREISGDLVLMACGVAPNIGFLQASGVRGSRGVLVDEKMRTNIPNIFAAGDVAESIDPYGGRELVFNWYNAVDQGWVAGCNLVGVERQYRASPALAVLKGAEPPVVSVGSKYGEAGYETLSRFNEGRGVYEKIFIKDDRVDCYQAIGVADKVGLMYGYIKGRQDIRAIRDILLSDDLAALLVK